MKEEKCKWNKKNDCNDCPYEGCPSYGAQLTEGDLEGMTLEVAVFGQGTERRSKARPDSR